jgi:hypothetical protein
MNKIQYEVDVDGVIVTKDSQTIHELSKPHMAIKSVFKRKKTAEVCQAQELNETEISSVRSSEISSESDGSQSASNPNYVKAK